MPGIAASNPGSPLQDNAIDSSPLYNMPLAHSESNLGSPHQDNDTLPDIAALNPGSYPHDNGIDSSPLYNMPTAHSEFIFEAHTIQKYVNKTNE